MRGSPASAGSSRPPARARGRRTAWAVAERLRASRARIPSAAAMAVAAPRGAGPPPRVRAWRVGAGGTSRGRSCAEAVGGLGGRDDAVSARRSSRATRTGWSGRVLRADVVGRFSSLTLQRVLLCKAFGQGAGALGRGVTTGASGRSVRFGRALATVKGVGTSWLFGSTALRRTAGPVSRGGRSTPTRRSCRRPNGVRCTGSPWSAKTCCGAAARRSPRSAPGTRPARRRHVRHEQGGGGCGTRRQPDRGGSAGVRVGHHRRLGRTPRGTRREPGPGRDPGRTAQAGRGVRGVPVRAGPPGWCPARTGPSYAAGTGPASRW
ncbi:hypothetical protein SCALM49S_02112 [Streptomyces californicus]